MQKPFYIAVRPNPELPSLSFRSLFGAALLSLLFAIGCGGDPGAPALKEVVSRAGIEEIEAGIRAYIEHQTAAGNGYFHMQDGDRELRLKLVRVHTEYLSNLGPGRYFACVDLADVSGDVFDVDFFLEGTPGAMEVTEVSLHKLNGKPFYTWQQLADKTWDRVPLENASRELLGILEGEDHFTFSYRALLPTLEGPARLWVPVAVSDDFQDVQMLNLHVPGKHRLTREQRYGNTVLFAELLPDHSGDTLEIIYHVRRREKSAYTDTGADPLGFLEGDRLVPVGGRMAELSAEILHPQGERDDLHRARMLYDYIIDNMRYMKFGDYGRGDAQYACDTKTGNCTEFHAFFMSLARSAGIPARFAIGATIPSDRDEGGIDGYHCWAEFYADGKWWPVDISEGNKYSALATYYFGRHPANRLEISRGRDLVLEPSPTSGPVNFLVYPLLEDMKKGQTYTILPSFHFERG
jgi:transglutaminase-like putative cysteine protease